MKKALTSLAVVITALTLSAPPADAYTSSKPSSSPKSSSSNKSSPPKSSTGGKSSSPPKTSPPATSPPATSAPNGGKSVAPPKNTGGSVPASNKTSTATSKKVVAPKATKERTTEYFSSSGGSVRASQGNRATSYDYRDPVTNQNTTFDYRPPSFYQSSAGSSFLAGMGAGILVDRFFGPNYANPASSLYNQPIPPGYELRNGDLIVAKKHSVLGTILAWFFGLLLMAGVIVGIYFAYRWFKRRKGDGSFADGF